MAPRLVVIGAGEAGLDHARRLKRAVAAGRLAAEVELVEDGWGEYLGRWLERPEAAGGWLVPAPVQPHLVWEWLRAVTGALPAPPPVGWALPFELPGPDGVLYLSAAAWRCPAACVEPAHCPVLHAPRDWDLAGIIEERAAELGLGAAVFRLEQIADGVAGIRVSELLAARDRLQAAGPGTEFLVATSSRCHAAVASLRARSSG